MSDDDDTYLPAEVTAAAMLGLVDLDPELVACPRCGNQLRSEVRDVWRTLAETSVVMEFEVTAEMVRESGGKLDAFGRVKCAVPYVSCMHCGFDADASRKAFIEPGSEQP